MSSTLNKTAWPQKRLDSFAGASQQAAGFESMTPEQKKLDGRFEVW